MKVRIAGVGISVTKAVNTATGVRSLLRATYTNHNFMTANCCT